MAAACEVSRVAAPDPPLAQFTLGGIPITLTSGPELREFHLAAPKACSAFAILANLLMAKLEATFDCECGFIDQRRDHAKIANTFVQPCRGVSILGFPRDETTERADLGSRELQAVLEAMAAGMPGREEFSDHLEQLECKDEERSAAIANRHNFSVAWITNKPKTAPLTSEVFAIGQTRVTLESFGGAARWHLGFEGPRGKTWETARLITDALKEHKLACDCRIPLSEAERLLDRHCIVLEAGKPENKDDYAKWYWLETPPRMVIFPRPTYDKAMLASGFNIARLALVTRVLKELAERHPATALPADASGAKPRDYSKPSGTPEKTREFQISNKFLTLSRYAGDSRLHLEIQGFSADDMLEPVFLIGDAIQEDNLACHCAAVAEIDELTYAVSCFIDPSHKPAFNARDIVKDYSQKQIDLLDHLGNPARMVIQPMSADAPQIRDAGMNALTFDRMCTVLEALSARFPPFVSDLLIAYNELPDKARERESRRTKKSNDQNREQE